MDLLELESILGQAVRRTAERLGVKDTDFYAADELRGLVKEENDEVSECLEAFIKSYQEWFDFHRRNATKGKQVKLSSDESGQLAELVRQRNPSRQKLLATLSPLA